eukprot:9413502-Alexandrium_andersonii.AAC.1
MLSILLASIELAKDPLRRAKAIRATQFEKQEHGGMQFEDILRCQTTLVERAQEASLAGALRDFAMRHEWAIGCRGQ